MACYVNAVVTFKKKNSFDILGYNLPAYKQTKNQANTIGKLGFCSFMYGKFRRKMVENCFKRCIEKL